MSNYFNEDLSKFFNSSQNPEYKLNFLISAFSNLSNFLINKTKIIPDLYKLQKILENIDISFYKLYNVDHLTSSTIGYNSVSIQSIYMDSNYDININSIDKNILNVYELVYDIYNSCDKDMGLFRSLSILYNTNTYNYITYLLQYSFTLNPFHFIHNCEKYPTTYNYDDLIVFPFIYQYVFFLKVYESSSDINSIASTLISTKPTYSKSKLIDYFKEYIDINKNTIIIKIITYFNNNIFLLGDIISPTFINNIIAILTDSILNLKSIFETCPEVDDLLNEITALIVHDIIIQSYSYTTLTNLYTDGYYNTDELFTFSSNIDYFNKELNIIKSQISDWLNLNVEYLSNLELLSYKYKMSPLFFLNSYYILNSGIVDALSSNSINLIDIEQYLLKITITNTNVSNIKTYIENKKILFNQDTIKYSILIHFKKLISVFINSDLFTTWILTDLYPKIISINNNIYPVNTDNSYKNIDILKLLFNVIFTNDLISNILFKTYTDTLILDFKTVLNTITVDVNITDSFKDSVNTIFLDNKHFQDIISNFFRASVVSKYINGLLTPYSITN